MPLENKEPAFSYKPPSIKKQTLFKLAIASLKVQTPSITVSLAEMFVGLHEIKAFAFDQTGDNFVVLSEGKFVPPKDLASLTESLAATEPNLSVLPLAPPSAATSSVTQQKDKLDQSEEESEGALVLFIRLVIESEFCRYSGLY